MQWLYSLANNVSSTALCQGRSLFRLATLAPLMTAHGPLDAGELIYENSIFRSI